MRHLTPSDRCSAKQWCLQNTPVEFSIARVNQVPTSKIAIEPMALDLHTAKMPSEVAGKVIGWSSCCLEDWRSRSFNIHLRQKFPLDFWIKMDQSFNAYQCISMQTCWCVPRVAPLRKHPVSSKVKWVQEEFVETWVAWQILADLGRSWQISGRVENSVGQRFAMLVALVALVACEIPWDPVRSCEMFWGMLGVSKVRSHSCKCIEQSSLLLLSKTAFRALVDMTGRKWTEQKWTKHGRPGRPWWCEQSDLRGFQSRPVVHTAEHPQHAQTRPVGYVHLNISIVWSSNFFFGFEALELEDFSLWVVV